MSIAAPAAPPPHRKREEPLRGELFSIDHLRSHAAHLSSVLKVIPHQPPNRKFFQQFQRNAEQLRAAHRRISHSIRGGEPMTPDAEWLLDNFYVVEEHLHEIQQDLPPAYFRELPKLSDGNPRILRLAEELIIHTDSVVLQGDLAAFVNEFQRQAPLTIGELWALPIMLRLSLVENLDRLARQSVAFLQQSAAAKALLRNWESEEDLPLPLRLGDPRPELVAQAFRVSTELFPDDPARSAALEQLLTNRFPNAADVLRDEHRRQAANQVSIGNVITSMRLISALDWITFFEETSHAERILRTDPAGAYEQMDAESRNQYRNSLEQLAKRSGRSELWIAERVIERSQEAIPAGVLAPIQSHVGYWLIDDGRPDLERELQARPGLSESVQRAMRVHPNAAYFSLMAVAGLIGLVAMGVVAFTTDLPWWAAVILLLTAVIPLSEIIVLLVNLIITHSVPPRRLPKLEFPDGVPKSCRAFVVVPAMLSNRKEVDALLDRLELHYVGNPEPELRFALLTDFADSATETCDSDADLIAQAVAGIRRLNGAYSAGGKQPFYLFHRSRQWNACEQVWMGWERKRGKLTEFNRLLHGQKNTSYLVQEGDLSFLESASADSAIPFVITLDADTQLPLGTARRLIGTLAHPLNRALIAPGDVFVQHGYSILQPRVSVQLKDANTSRFAQLFANGKGLDPYATASSDVYQDLFGEGSFTGKGIYDVRAFEAALDKAFGENQILSHDLIEGCHARVGLVSDIEVIDGFPSRYDAEMRRQHRWARGDWQIMPWLFGHVPCAHGTRPNRLSLLSRWKIFDNLRRSLVAPSIFLLLAAAWFLAPAFAALWTMIAWLVIGWPMIATAVDVFLRWPRLKHLRSHLYGAAIDLVRALGQTAVQAACLPYRAWIMSDAVIRTLIRLGVTRRKMLEWETAAATEHRLTRSRMSVVRQMALIPVAAVILAVLIPFAAWPTAAPWLLAWALSPWIADYISMPLESKRKQLSAADRQWLRLTARNTWTYFESYVGPRTHWLPPDNLQEYPEEKLAERISPTNEGLFLVSALVARDFGYLGLHALVELWEKNFASWMRLPQHQGHFYNWYDTATLQPLTPRYVSTVDSGNLAASLLVVQQGVHDLFRSPLFGAHVWDGLRDTIAVAIQSCDQLQPRGARIVSPPLDELTAALNSIAAIVRLTPNSWDDRLSVLTRARAYRNEIAGKLGTFLASHRHPSAGVERKVRSLLSGIDALAVDAALLVPWCEAYAALQHRPLSSLDSTWPRIKQELDSTQSLEQIVRLPQTLSPHVSAATASTLDDDGMSRIQSLFHAVQRGADAAAELQRRLSQIAGAAEQLAMGMNFEFLYNRQRRLFAIGFNLEDGRLDRSHYDMLCSEARLSSHLAIAKGDVDYRHWFHLGRQLTFTAGQPGLLSWGGTMFEFLMPILFQRSFKNSLLTQACEAAVARQQEYGRLRSTPWGISESAFATLAANSDYCYQSFGVPGLGLKRGLSEDLVIAPYATMLALPIAPQAAIANLQHLAKEGALGSMGFYDALDFTPMRVPPGRTAVPVQCYMAHHQAMSLIAIANVLLENSIERRFHRHPLIRATEMLLEEVVPTAAPVLQPHVDEAEEAQPVSRPESSLVSRRMTGFESPAPRTHLLSNGAYAVMVTNTGGGYSRRGDIGVNRWRPDVLQDSGGHFLYIQDRRTGQFWSATYQPTCQTPDSYEVTYSIDKAEYRRRDGDIETHLEVAVSPDTNVEVRQLTITNHGRRVRELEITSYTEVTLTTPAADLAHPAFQKLFVETEYVPESTALVAMRRPRESHVAPVWGVHVLACSQLPNESIQYESSREKFLGRGGDVHFPSALASGQPLSGTSGLVLDPVFSLRCRLRIDRQSVVCLAFSTGMADSREDALKIADEFHESRSVQRAFELAWVFNQVQLQQLHLSAANAHRSQRLAANLLFPHSSLRGDQTSLLTNRQSQSALWRFGISGDKPILLVKAEEPQDVVFVKELLLAREYWHYHGLDADLVILNVHPGSYLDALHEQLQRAVQESPCVRAESRKSIFLLRAAQMSQEDQGLLEAVAYVVLTARRGWALSQPGAARNLKRKSEQSRVAQRNGVPRPGKRLVRVSNKTAGSASVVSEEELCYWNGIGGFANDGREYHLHLLSERTPTPWSNVIANARFGCLVTESGGGFTWSDNSRQNKLTTWSNDPIGDSPAEILYIRNDVTGEVWRPLSSQQPSEIACVQHGQGYTRFLRSQGELHADVLVSVASDDALKMVCVTLHNEGRTVLRLSATYYAELVLGVCREQTQMHLVSEIDSGTGALLMRNSYRSSFADQVVFLRAIGPDTSATGDRASFLGRNGHWRNPVGLTAERLPLSTGAGFDPCGVVQSRLTLRPGQTTEIAFLLGCGNDAEDARRLIERYARISDIHQAVAQTKTQWDETLTAVQVKTPNRAFDLLVNRWLVYQVLSCRLWGRSAFYQSGGAYGFRDQLQDVMALVYTRPDLVREHLLRAAARQYEDGGVQHWWHPPDGAGTRTRFSDDFLWLPFCAAHYALVTGDERVFDEIVPFLHSHPLAPDEQERYELPQISAESASLFEHCLRSLKHGTRLGEHGLPLIGCGDWNDGFSQIGTLGRGESVWVGWFLLVLLDHFLPLMERRGEQAAAQCYRQFAADLRTSLELHAWDGQWYRRAYFDNGTPLGSMQNDECQIDSIAQSWAVLAQADPQRTDRAIEAVFDRLVSRKDRLVKLLSPPFDQTQLEPGYIKGYVAGVRENGGQYTHAVAWLIQALAAKGDGERAMEIFDLINPVLHTRNSEELHQYRAEPYVIAADVYSVAPHTGRGGWTWYTGSASWVYRVAVETLLGVTVRAGRVRFLPCLPDDWSHYEITLRVGASTWRFSVQLDDSDSEPQEIELRDDGELHEVVVHARNRRLALRPLVGDPSISIAATTPGRHRAQRA